MAEPTIYSIGLFIDGGYYAEIDNGLFAENRRVNLKGLINHIRKEIAEYFGLPKERCLVTEFHFFRGRRVRLAHGWELPAGLPPLLSPNG